MGKHSAEAGASPEISVSSSISVQRVTGSDSKQKIYLQVYDIQTCPRWSFPNVKAILMVSAAINPCFSDTSNKLA